MAKKAARSYQAAMRFSPRLVVHLSRDLYNSSMHALAETVTNGNNACIRKGVPPLVQIIRRRDEIVFIDNGDGMDDDRLRKFLLVGVSPELADLKQEAQFGIGKLGPLAYGSKYRVRTCPDDTNTVHEFVLDTEAIARSVEEVAINIMITQRDENLYDPAEGSFTTITVTDLLRTAPSADTIIKKLSDHLPLLGDWTVTVNGKVVPHREYEGKLIEVTYESAAGPIQVRLAVSTDLGECDDDVVELAGGQGRPICPLSSVPTARSLFPSEIFDVRVSGMINISKGGKGWQTASRGQIKPELAEGPEFQSIAEGFRRKVLPILRERLTVLDDEADMAKVRELLMQVADQIRGAFPQTETGRSGQSGGSTSTGSQAGTGKTKAPSASFSFVYEGERFTIMPIRKNGEQPVRLIRAQKVIVIDVGCILYKVAARGSAKALASELRRWLIEAAILYKSNTDTAEATFYRINAALIQLENKAQAEKAAARRKKAA